MGLFLTSRRILAGRGRDDLPRRHDGHDEDWIQLDADLEPSCPSCVVAITSSPPLRESYSFDLIRQLVAVTSALAFAAVPSVRFTVSSAQIALPSRHRRTRPRVDGSNRMVLFQISHDPVQHADRLRHFDLHQPHQLRNPPFVLEHFVPHRLLPMPHALHFLLAIRQPGLRFLQLRSFFVTTWPLVRDRETSGSGAAPAAPRAADRSPAASGSSNTGPIVLQPFLHPPHLATQLRERIAHLLGKRHERHPHGFDRIARMNFCGTGHGLGRESRVECRAGHATDCATVRL